MGNTAVRLGAGLACVLVGAACDAAAPGGPDIIGVEVTPTGPLVHTASISLTRAEAVTVRYGPTGGPVLEVVREEPAIEHAVALTRLLPNTTYRYTVTAGGTAADGLFTTGGVDEDLTALDFVTEGTAPHALTLLEVNDGEGFHGAVILDDEGRIVWYFRTQGAFTGSTVRANGNFVFVDLQAGLLEVAPTGEVVATLSQSPERSIHHDVVETPSGSLLFLATDPRDVDGASIVGDAIWEWTPGAAPVRRWSSFDHLSPDVDWGVRSRPTDWLHANSLSLGPRGNHVVSLNFLNQILSVSPDFTELEWRLGGLNATIPVGPEGVFSGQHTAAELTDDRVLMFDNGIERSEPFSRGLELRISGGQASVLRDFRPNPLNWSRAISSAFRTPDGVTLILYGLSEGAAGSTGPVEAFAYLDDAQTPSWHLRLPLSVFSVYRATPLATIAGETTAH